MKSKILGLLTVGLLAGPVAHAATINFSSDPGFISGQVSIGGVAVSGSFELTPGVGQSQTVWGYYLFVNPTTTFSDVPFSLDLNLNGVTHAISFLASATALGGEYSFVSNGTTLFDLAGIGIVAVSGISVVTNISNPGDAGPTQANFFLRPTTSAPEPGTLALLGLGLAGLGLSRRRTA